MSYKIIKILDDGKNRAVLSSSIYMRARVRLGYGGVQHPIPPSYLALNTLGPTLSSIYQLLDDIVDFKR